ncbi:hypothetical protein BJX70DRAFT_388295 [Aspergillus crustosus]
MTSVSSGPVPIDLDAMDAMNRQSLQQSASPAQTSPNMRGSISTDFFKFFSSRIKKHRLTRIDGQPAKRRGPKPDSKPALTRRQELNRQAQRTHRERKEQYMKALESEVARLREAYTQEISAANLAVHQHREMVHAVTEENNMLKEILASHNINLDAEIERRKSERPMPAFHSSPITGGSVGSQTAGVASFSGHTYSTPPTTVSSDMSPKVNGVDKVDFSSVPDISPHGGHGHTEMPCDALAAIDRRPAIQHGGIFESQPQLQVDFILALESPCREHTDYLCRRSITETEDEDMPFSGHALMATCPPPSYIANTSSEQIYPHKTYDLPHANLSTLLNLSRQLVTEGQITPIMALQALKSHEMYTKLTRDDVKLIMDTLENKVRCYGFGAVLEDFELMDCFSSVLGSKVEVGLSQPADEMLYS